MNDKLYGIQMEMTDEYKKFVQKFKPKKTTDDCYTPQNVYEAVKMWAVKKYGLQNAKVIRPFYPGGDYTGEDYSGNCVVIDNPPFSILAAIRRFYTERGIRFFLFAPALTLFSTGEGNYVIVGANITYDNGAKIRTSFITNLGEYKICVEPDLLAAIKRENDKNERAQHKQLPVYKYPVYVTTAAGLNYLAAHGERLAIRAEDVAFIRKLDEQTGKTIFGGGFLLSEKAAAEKAAAEKAAAIVYELSEREKAIVRILTERSNNELDKREG